MWLAGFALSLDDQLTLFGVGGVRLMSISFCGGVVVSVCLEVLICLLTSFQYSRVNEGKTIKEVQGVIQQMEMHKPDKEKAKKE